MNFWDKKCLKIINENKKYNLEKFFLKYRLKLRNNYVVMDLILINIKFI